MTPRPVVLITSIPRSVETALGICTDNASVNQRFGTLVVAAGGVPVASDAWADPELLAERVDAIVINGGRDVAPSRYGAQALETTNEPDHRRDEFEFGLVECARERNLPVLGVCRGMQLLNVALGGTLIQHVPAVTNVKHYVTNPHDQPVHNIDIKQGSSLQAALGKSRTSVNTVHHQAVDRLGAGLHVTARAPDGTIEAIADREGCLLGVQWHPEFLVGKPGEEQVGIFRLLLQSCSPQSRNLRRLPKQSR